jgi:hypothetical protein
VVQDTANKHNILAEIVRNQFAQITGKFQGIDQNFQQMHDRVGALERDMKMLSFYLGRSREENLALRTLLQNNLGMEKFEETFDQLLKRDFLVNSNGVPVGTCQISEYN